MTIIFTAATNAVSSGWQSAPIRGDRTPSSAPRRSAATICAGDSR
jgi:hypothetical protein